MDSGGLFVASVSASGHRRALHRRERGVNTGTLPWRSWCRIAMNHIITAAQYRSYPITDPYVAELVQPRTALKMPHPPPPLSSGLQQFTCQTLCLISYDPGPDPVSELSPPVIWFHALVWRYHTPRENRPADTRYRKHVETTKKIWREA